MEHPEASSSVALTLTQVHAQYDWTTGVPGGNGKEWRKFRVVPRSRTPCIPCFFVLVFIGVETEKGFYTTRGGRGSCQLYGGNFARSYSVSIKIDS